MALPDPTCGGLKIKIEGALPCDRIVQIAIEALRERAPQQLSRGVAAIDVEMGVREMDRPPGLPISL